MELLTGDVEARWSAGAITRSQAMALWNLIPISAQALVNAGPDLIGTFIAGAGLAERAVIRVQGTEDWFYSLETIVANRQSDTEIGSLVQSDLFEQYTRVLRAVALEAPLVLILDDLQWADMGSISLLFHLGAHLKGSKILVVGAYRPVEVAIGRGGERHPLAPVVSELQRRYGDFELNLDKAGNREFIEALIDSEPNQLGVPFRDMLFRQTRGQPLFLVELLRGLQERNDIVRDEMGRWVEGPALDWETIPARMEAVIKERIERLPSLLQRAMRAASVEGEFFTIEVLARVLSVDEQELLHHLNEELERRHRLVRAHSIQRVDGQYISTYRFRHIQIQKYLYSNLNQIERVRLHEQVGEILEELYRVEDLGEDLMEISLVLTPAVQLARHFQEAGITTKAVNYLHIAGLRAVFLSGYQEAISHMRKGLSLLETLPDTLENKRQALSLQVSLGKSMKGGTSVALPEVEMILKHTYELCQQVGEPSQMWSILGELAIMYYVRGEYIQARKYAEESLELAREMEEPIYTALSLWIIGFVLFALGEFTASRSNFAKMIDFYDPEKHFRPFVYLRGVDAGLSAMAYEACCLWCLGYQEQAMQKSEQVLNLAKHKNHPFTLADVLTYAGCVFCEFTGDAVQLKDHADHLVDLSESTGLSWLAAGMRYKGEALALLGQVEAGYAEAMKGVYEQYSFYSECFVSGVLAKIGFTFAEAGNLEKAMALIDSAFEISEKKKEFYCLSELYRIKGEIHRLAGHEDKAESCFLNGLEFARQQSAKSWELRVTLSLARLWQAQGKKAEARQALVVIYDWFAEGFGTPDLMAAKSLLDELA
jgi:tetratricopeptide (TPR) repeat protein